MGRRRRSMGFALILGLALLSGGRFTVLAKPAQKMAFGKTADGQDVELYTLTNKNGMHVAITNFGASVVRIQVADRQGQVEDVVLGYDALDGYVRDQAYFGAVIGRYGNRIAAG